MKTIQKFITPVKSKGLPSRLLFYQEVVDLMEQFAFDEFSLLVETKSGTERLNQLSVFLVAYKRLWGSLNDFLLAAAEIGLKFPNEAQILTKLILVIDNPKKSND